MSDHSNTAPPTDDVEFRSEDPDNPGTYQEIKNITRFGRGKAEVREKEVSGINASEVQRKRRLKDRDPFTVTFNFDPDDPVHIRLYAAFHAGTTDNYEYARTAAGKAIQGQCYIRSWNPNDVDAESFDEVTAEFRQDPSWDWATFWD